VPAQPGGRLAFDPAVSYALFAGHVEELTAAVAKAERVA
jgi:hypothetical protein